MTQRPSQRPEQDEAAPEAAGTAEAHSAVEEEWLRRAAEQRLGRASASASAKEENDAPAPPEATSSGPVDLEHELRVQRTELEIQNEELREVEQSLETSRREFFALFDLAPVGYLTIDAHGTIGRANLTASEMLGSDRLRLPGRPLSSYLSPGYARPFFDHVAKVLGTKQSVSCELAFKAQRGGVFHARVTSSMAPPSLSDDADVFLTMVDITDQVQANEALTDREQRLRAIVDNAPLAIALLDHTNRLIDCNEFFERLVEQRSPELLGQELLGFVDPGDRGLVRALMSGGARSVQPELRIGPGAREVRAWMTPVDSGPREEPRRLLLMEDVSERKRAIERADFLASELLDAHREKLQALGQLAGGVAHDFNNMLAAIMAFAESAMLTDELPASIREDLAGIRSASLRARDLVREVLTFARRRRPVRGEVDLFEIVQSSIALVKGAAPSHVQFEFAGEPGASVFVDAGQLEQAIVNVLTNAVQALGPEPGLIRTELERADLRGVTQSDGSVIEPGTYWRLSIRDDGPGIEPAVLARIFEPFFTTRERAGGCGMGLATCLAVAELHGGLLEVSSEPGLGAEFRFFLPLHRQVVSEATLPTPSRRHFSGEVLVVDDEDLVLRSSRRVLMSLGVHAETCSSPIEAQDLLRSSPSRFDAVITDYSMPELSGVQLAREINSVAPELPVLLLTGNRARIEGEDLSRATIAGVIEKPLSVRELSDVLLRIGLKEQPVPTS